MLKYSNHIVHRVENSMNLIDKISFVLLLMVDDDQEEEFVNNIVHLFEKQKKFSNFFLK
jgi:hypothetical protein